MGVESSGHSGKEGPDHKGRHLELCRVDPHGGGGDLIVPHSQKSTAIGRTHQGDHRVQGGHCCADGPEKIGRGQDSLHAARSPDGIGILQQHANDFAESERHHRQIISPQPQRRPPDNQPGNRSNQSGNQEHRQKGQLRSQGSPGPRKMRQRRRKDLACQNGGAVGTHRHESGVAE